MDNEANTEPLSAAKRSSGHGLQTLLAVAAVVVLLVVLVTWLGYAGFLLSLLILAGVAAYCRWWTMAFFLFGFTVIIPCLGAPPYRFPGDAARRFQCVNNLKQLGVALRNYHDAQGTFPPAYVADANGKPMHSWRVLILPYIGRDDLYKRYRFDEPWDGPNNRKLHGEIVKWFQCPSQNSVANPQATSYVAVVGPRTAWRGDRPVKLSDFIDNPETTILLVETMDSGIHWMEPRDLEYPPMPAEINPPSGGGISSYHMDLAYVLYADGSVSSLPNDAENIDAPLTIDDGAPSVSERADDIHHEGHEGHEDTSRP